MDERFKKSSIRRDLVIAGLIGFAVAALGMAVALAITAATLHSNCTIH